MNDNDLTALAGAVGVLDERPAFDWRGLAEMGAVAAGMYVFLVIGGCAL